ncbi:hypothetical protein C7414_12320 [Cupriavidus alkaliphilus]|nr:hypothetical protein C7414_12320 [Cupriavidus alkaliphilus]SCB36995.1 hypothetical protein GA0116996_12030 [Cupriavidus alkaliphilus]
MTTAPTVQPRPFFLFATRPAMRRQAGRHLPAASPRNG